MEIGVKKVLVIKDAKYSVIILRINKGNYLIAKTLQMKNQNSILIEIEMIISDNYDIRGENIEYHKHKIHNLDTI